MNTGSGRSRRSRLAILVAASIPRRGNVVPGYDNLVPNMTGLPHAQALVWYDVDVNRLEEMVLQLEPRDHAQTVQIDNLRGNRRARPTILDSNPNAFFPFIDSRVTDRMYGARMNQAGHLPILDDLVSDQEKKKQAAAREKAAGETWKTEFFKKHPQADANKDGKLTWYELQSFQKKTGN